MFSPPRETATGILPEMGRRHIKNLLAASAAHPTPPVCCYNNMEVVYFKRRRRRWRRRFPLLIKIFYRFEK